MKKLSIWNRFRVWDRNTRKMLYPYRYREKENTSRVECLAKFEDDNGLIMHISDVIMLAGDLYFPMLDSGFKDKNGKAIYQGDIIEWKTHPFGDDKKKCRCVFDIITEGGSGSFYSTPHINFTSEVIGNIYENPGLMEEKQKNG